MPVITPPPPWNERFPKKFHVGLQNYKAIRPWYCNPLFNDGEFIDDWEYSFQWGFLNLKLFTYESSLESKEGLFTKKKYDFTELPKELQDIVNVAVQEIITARAFFLKKDLDDIIEKSKRK